MLATSVIFDVTVVVRSDMERKGAMYMYILRVTVFCRLMSTTKLDSTPALKLYSLL